MRLLRVFAVIAPLTLGANAAYAQADTAGLTPLQTAVACALPPVLAGTRSAALRIVGTLDTVPRTLFSPRDLLVINGGTKAGVQLGQRFFVRRAVTFGSTSPSRTHAVRTSGWIGVVAVTDTTAIAAVDVACGDISSGDYLEPFAAPVVPNGADRNESSGEPDFTALGRVLFGNEESSTAAAGDFMLIDRGSDRGVAPGSRFGIYRDLQVAGVPLASIGEGVVVSAGNRLAVMRITAARTAVQRGDFVAPRKP